MTIDSKSALHQSLTNGSVDIYSDSDVSVKLLLKFQAIIVGVWQKNWSQLCQGMIHHRAFHPQNDKYPDRLLQPYEYQ